MDTEIYILYNTSQNISIWGIFSQPFKNVKTVLSSWALYKEVAGQSAPGEAPYVSQTVVSKAGRWASSISLPGSLPDMRDLRHPQTHSVRDLEKPSRGF